MIVVECYCDICSNPIKGKKPMRLELQKYQKSNGRKCYVKEKSLDICDECGKKLLENLQWVTGNEKNS